MTWTADKAERARQMVADEPWAIHMQSYTEVHALLADALDEIERLAGDRSDANKFLHDDALELTKWRNRASAAEQEVERLRAALALMREVLG